MAEISVTIIDTANVSKEFNANTDYTVEHVMPYILKEFGLVSGGDVTYTLARETKTGLVQLLDSQTLAKAGVNQGDTLRLGANDEGGSKYRAQTAFQQV